MNVERTISRDKKEMSVTLVNAWMRLKSASPNLSSTTGMTSSPFLFSTEYVDRELSTISQRLPPGFVASASSQYERCIRVLAFVTENPASPVMLEHDDKMIAILKSKWSQD